MSTRRPLAALALALTTLAAGPGATALAATPAADAGSSSPYAAYAAAASTIGADDPAPADWNTTKADNSSSTFSGAFKSSTGRLGWFGQSWYDVDGNGCDTRDDVMARDMVGVTYKKGSTCVIESGRLSDPYTGKTISFTRGKNTSSAVQIDHMVPLGYAYAHGAWRWDADKRLKYANDPDILVSADGPANGEKSDSGPRTSPKGQSSNGTYTTDGGTGWMPPNAAYTCEYAASFTSVLTRYGIGAPKADKDFLVSTLKDCATQNVSMDTTVKPLAQQTLDKVSGQVSAAAMTAVKKAGQVQFQTNADKVATGATDTVSKATAPIASRIESWVVGHPMETFFAFAVLVAILGGGGAGRGRRR